MDSDVDLARSTVDQLNRFDMRNELFPLAAPVGTNLIFPDYTPAFRCLGPLTLSLISANALSMFRWLKAE
jgi:hypothetical protein